MSTGDHVERVTADVVARLHTASRGSRRAWLDDQLVVQLAAVADADDLTGDDVVARVHTAAFDTIPERRDVPALGDDEVAIWRAAFSIQLDDALVVEPGAARHLRLFEAVHLALLELESDAATRLDRQSIRNRHRSALRRLEASAVEPAVGDDGGDAVDAVVDAEAGPDVVERAVEGAFGESVVTGDVDDPTALP